MSHYIAALDADSLREGDYTANLQNVALQHAFVVLPGLLSYSGFHRSVNPSMKILVEILAPSNHDPNCVRAASSSDKLALCAMDRELFNCDLRL